MTEIIPNFFNLSIPTNYDASIERTTIQEIHPNNLNYAVATQLNFNYDGSELYRLSSNNTGFRCTFTYVTQGQNNANDMNANITLANNFFSNFFDKVSLSLGNKEVEGFTSPGVVTDILSNIKESEYRENSGALHTFIPDTNIGGANDIPVTSTFTTGAQFAANADQNHIVANAATYNKGYRRRKELYNYTVGGNDVARTVQVFVPLNTLFGFCAENDKVLKHIKLHVQLVIGQANTIPRCYYGGANTGMVFINNNRGLTNIVLELEILFPRPEIILDLEKQYEKPISLTYLSRWVDTMQIGIQRQFTYRQAFSKSNQGLPKYCFIVFKRDQAETAQTNFSRCCHCNIQNINVRYLSNRYPFLDQNADFNGNQFAKFYNQFTEIAKSLGHCTGLSMKDFKDLYTIFAIDMSAQKDSTGGDVAVEIIRREVAANNDSAANPRDLVGYIVFLCEKTVTLEVLKNFVKDD